MEKTEMKTGGIVLTLEEAIKHCKENVQKETQNGNLQCAIEHNQLAMWLSQLEESKAKANISDEAIKAFQEIIRNQCDEISALKAQLTWRPVSEKPEKAGVYFVEGKPYTGCESTIITTAYFDGEIFLWYVVVRWLPISPAPAPEGE